MRSSSLPLELFPGVEFNLDVPPGTPEVHDAYRGFRDQKDMVCGPYTLTYLLRAYGFDAVDGVPVTVDSTAAAAGTALESHNADRQASIKDAIDADTIPPERVGTWFPHGHYEYRLDVADEGGCSPEGLVTACETVTDGRMAAVPVPATIDGTTQLDDDGFDAVLSAVFNSSFATQMILNYNLQHTLAPAGLLGHRYTPLALLTRWDEPDYFRTLDWDVGHFTSLAGRVTRSDCDTQYLVIRDSYRTFGWNGYHLQPRASIRSGLARDDDNRDGGVLLVTPSDRVDDLKMYLSDRGVSTGLWDNGSAYCPHTNPFA